MSMYTVYVTIIKFQCLVAFMYTHECLCEIISDVYEEKKNKKKIHFA